MTGKPRVGFIGVGLMGEGMARRVLEAGFPLSVLAHRSRTRIGKLVAEGAQEAASAAELAGASDIIIMCVSNAGAVEQAVEGMRPGLSAGKIIVDTTTSEPELTRRLASELGEEGIVFCDAPLTGGAAQAASGELGILFGGQPETLTRLQPVLKTFATRVEHFGAAGSGHVAKLINNYLVCGMVALIADTYNAAREHDVDWARLYSVMQQGSNFSPALERIVGNAIRGDLDGYKFSLANAHKDMALYLKLSDGLSGPSGLAAAVMDEYDDALDRGLGDLMVSRLIDPDLQD